MSRPLVAAVPSYGRPGPLRATLDGVARFVRPDDVMVLEQDAPMGPGRARHALCSLAVERYGRAFDLLMLDDDLRFHPETQPESFRMAARLLDPTRQGPVRPPVGIVQLPNRDLPRRDGRPAEKVPACHAFILAGEMLASGVNYDPDEYGDDVAMSLIAYFAGWRVVTSSRAVVRHHVSRRGVLGKIGGGIEAAHAAGVPVSCRLFPEWRERGWVVYSEGSRDGVALPTPYDSVRVTPAGRAAHIAAWRAR